MVTAAYKGLLREPLLFQGSGDLRMRIAVFVDAGYLFAGGGTALTGGLVRRVDLSLSAASARSELIAFAESKAPECSLLRIYWYDGIRVGNAMSADQAAIADLDDVKLRLGFINGRGEQKGVDSLIVTDLIELARLHSISDAVLLSGDEDVRVGVQIAQNYGVRIHLLGIAPARGSQSPTLRQEADTTSEWDKDTVEKFLSTRADVALHEASLAISPPETDDDQLSDVVAAFFTSLEEADLEALAAFWKGSRGLPREFDAKLLALAASRLGRRLERGEMKDIRAAFQMLVTRSLKGL